MPKITPNGWKEWRFNRRLYHGQHDLIIGFFYLLLRIFLSRSAMGVIVRNPFFMKVTSASHAREPDLQIVLNDRANIVQETMVRLI